MNPIFPSESLYLAFQHRIIDKNLTFAMIRYDVVTQRTMIIDNRYGTAPSR